MTVPSNESDSEAGSLVAPEAVEAQVKTSAASKDRPLGKKIKGGSKVKRILTKSKGARSANKRLLSTR